MHDVSREMQACIDECLRCYQVCLGAAMSHCLEKGGKHVEPAHFRLMMACAEICRTAAHFMLIGTPHHKHTCRECAEICEPGTASAWVTCRDASRHAGVAPRAAAEWRRDALIPA